MLIRFPAQSISPVSLASLASVSLLALLALLLSIATGCQQTESSSTEGLAPSTLTSNLRLAQNQEWKDYWYNGDAELTSFTLKQARYGDYYEGQAVQIFVTEPFSKSKLHKLNNPSAAPEDAVSVLKLNFTRDFNTGIYPYKTMQSVFTPAELKPGEQSLKLTTSVQEWCGHMFMQLNAEPEGGWAAESFSYFDGEGETDLDLDAAFLEDEVWTRIRINPGTLPTGEFQAIPSNLALRLNHLPIKTYRAKASLQQSESGLQEYSLEFPEIERKLTVSFGAEFPHSIEAWKESFPSGFGASRQILTTEATRNKSMKLDYWSRNRPDDGRYREMLGLQ